MQKVFVGLSGGVDSAVSAALLKREGYDVTGVFIKIWQPEFIECTWKEDRLDAMRVAAALEIPFREVDLSQSYKTEVIRDMLDGYAKGVTPNPDVLCNEKIKFGDFATWAFENGAEWIATGHYARTEERNGKSVLLRGNDPKKDQSYFLHRIQGETLARTIFPIGALQKSDVRALAREFGLPNAARKDSQGLCFVGDISLGEFLKRFITLVPGTVLDTHGSVVGTHEGAALYTIGQRHGFEISIPSQEGKVRYVTHVDVPANTITVSTDREEAARKECALENLHWITEAPAFPFKSDIATRYQEKVFEATIEKTDGMHRVVFSESHVCSPGQSLAIYQGEQCLGGGIIA